MGQGSPCYLNGPSASGSLTGYNQGVGQSWVSFKHSTGEGSAFKPHLVVDNVQSLKTVEIRASVPNFWTEATLGSSPIWQLILSKSI